MLCSHIIFFTLLDRNLLLHRRKQVFLYYVAYYAITDKLEIKIHSVIILNRLYSCVTVSQ